MALTPKMAEIKNQDMEEEVAQALIQLCCDTMLKVRDHGSRSQPLPAPPGLIAVLPRAGPGREPNGPADQARDGQEIQPDVARLHREGALRPPPPRPRAIASPAPLIALHPGHR